MSEMINPEILEKYVNTICRFGREEAPYWFVGLEEGGGKSEVEVAERLQRWSDRGFPAIDYLTNGDNVNSDHVSKFLPGVGKRAHLQTTWSNQLRVVLGIEGRDLHNEVVRKMQVSEHGTKDGNTSLLELFPLPCPSASAWIYKSCGLGEEYASKVKYQKKLLVPRVKRIFRSVSEHKPAVVTFTTWQQRHEIAEQVPGMNSIDIGTGKTKGQALIGHKEGAVVVVCTHPAHRISDKNVFYWGLGKAIRQLVDEQRLPAKFRES